MRRLSLVAAAMPSRAKLVAKLSSLSDDNWRTQEFSKACRTGSNGPPAVALLLFCLSSVSVLVVAVVVVVDAGASPPLLAAASEDEVAMYRMVLAFWPPWGAVVGMNDMTAGGQLNRVVVEAARRSGKRMEWWWWLLLLFFKVPNRIAHLFGERGGAGWSTVAVVRGDIAAAVNALAAGLETPT